MSKSIALAMASMSTLLLACGDPTSSGIADLAGSAPDLAGGGGDGGCPPAYTEDISACKPTATDYQPRKGAPGANGWAACISDDNTFHLIDVQLPPASARVIAFEAMAAKLWGNPSTPTKDNFLSARDDYSVAEGLASRIGRRQDINYPEVAGDDKFACSDPLIAAKPENRNRCAGPAKLKPIIDDAFTQGIGGNKPIVQAARIETALLWFFYLSSRSEVWTCSFDDITDCDAAAAYYTQDPKRDQPRGIARYVSALSPETHQRIFDALLAERCWRDIDKAFPTDSTTSTYYPVAQAQLNKAYLRGEALILRSRIASIGCASGEHQGAAIESVKILGELIDQQATLIDATNGSKLRTYTASPTSDPGAIAAALQALDAVFACP